MEFRIFNSFWDGQPNHLPLLTLRESKDEPLEWNLKTSISKLNSILNSNSDEKINDGIRQLLKSEDWRLHLVASISVLAVAPQKRSEFVDLIWVRLSHGSWISPQLLVVLSIIDKDFNSRAIKVLNEGFTVNYIKLSPMEHHVSRGGSNARAASEKVIDAIDYILKKDINESVGSEGGAIAKNWTEQLTRLADEGKIRIEKF